MHRTTLMLPLDLKHAAETQARREGISLGEFVRTAIEHKLRALDYPANDPMLSDLAVSDIEVPYNLSTDHDDYLVE